MLKATVEKTPSKTVKLLNIVTVIVAIAALIIMIRMINELHGAFNREYADAAFRHQFFEAAGNENMANHFEERMLKARNACGPLQVSADDIDGLLDAIELYP